MQPEESLNLGNPDMALAQLQEQVRKNPSDPKLRIFLFQLLAVLGQWDRCLTQLNVAGELDASNLLMVQTYREAIQCEVLRAEVFAGRRSPMAFGQPLPWLALLVEALRLDAENHCVEAQSLRNRAFDEAVATPGRFNGADFDWIADADSRLGPVLEAVVNGRYYWTPFQHICKIELEKPADLRDLVWMPATFTWINGGQASGLIPTRYCGSELAVDSSLKLARKTEWVELGEGAYRGLGQRVLATSVDEYALLDAREIVLGAGAG